MHERVRRKGGRRRLALHVERGVPDEEANFGEAPRVVQRRRLPLVLTTGGTASRRAT